jgi:uncharacterized protein YdiU (UPF0061 family)
VPVSQSYRPDPRFNRLGPEFADPVEPALFPQEIVRFRNDRAAATVGLDELTDDEWRDAFARFQPLPGNQPRPLAMRYHGHQFRTYNPDIGDGRGFLYAQLREAGSNRLLDLATKGSGQTPYSRFGDGRLTLKGGVREVLAAEMLQALGGPTCRIFSLVETGEELERGDEPSPTRSCVMTRLSHSHIRFGTFQRLAYFDRADLIAQLIDHVSDAYFPELGERPAGEARAVGLLEIAVARSAELCARWMAAGFVHGVLNTDNLNLTGESFDYGPWRFLPRMDPGLTPAYFDQTGLYAYGRQPEAVFWNLTQLAGCLALLAGQEPLVEALNAFGPAYAKALAGAMLARLGVSSAGEAADIALANAAFRALGEGGAELRWEPFFFDWFCADVARAMGGPRAELYRSEAFSAFRDVLAGHAPDRPERLRAEYFQRSGPEEMLVEEVETLWSAIAERDDWAPFRSKVAAVREAGGAWAIANREG